MSKSEFKTAVMVIVGLIAVIIFVAVLKIGYTKYLAVPQENARRDVYEQTQSYAHGKTQELAKYYEEYQDGSMEDKEVIKNLIQLNFTTFDENTIDNNTLRSFLTSQRGY